MVDASSKVVASLCEAESRPEEEPMRAGQDWARGAGYVTAESSGGVVRFVPQRDDHDVNHDLNDQKRSIR